MSHQNILNKIKSLIPNEGNTPFNYERFLVFDKAPYLDAFILGKPLGPFELEVQTSSRCNLACKWCIGEQIQSKNPIRNLPNAITNDNIDSLVDSILDMHSKVKSLDTVKFSGFIGEPLVNFEVTLKAIQRLSSAGIKVGLFTNGVFMTKDTWDILSKIDYVHISLDAGPESFCGLKEYNKNNKDKTFNKILSNIKGLVSARRKNNGSVKVNIGYVIVDGNHFEIHKTVGLVKEAGANMVRLKFDISHNYDANAPFVIEAFKQITKAIKDYHSPPEFCVRSIHSLDELNQNSHTDWKKENGCYLQHFMGTIGSNGNAYLCDHNTLSDAVPFGNAIAYSLLDIWNSDRRKAVADSVANFCTSNVCPPFGNRINLFLHGLMGLANEFGAERVVEALKELRNT